MPGIRAYAAVLVVAVASAPPVFAAQSDVPFEARINIQTSCSVSAGMLNFGNVGIISGGETASATVTVNCSSGTPYTISFSASSSVTNYNGQMVNGAANVAYSAVLSAAGGTGPGSHTILGILPAQATPASAIYTDNRTVYLNY